MPPLTEEKKTDINNTLNQVKERASQLGGATTAISADRLSQPVNRVTVPQPATPTLPKQAGQLVTNITRDVNGFITAQTDEAKQLKELQATYGQMNEQGSLSDLYNRTLEGAGVTGESFKELKDIQLQLTDMDTGSELTKTKIAGGAGQTLAQGQREVTQEDRENAVRSAGLAARAAVLQGNIQTATAAAKQAVDIAFQDRQLTAQNLLNQIEMVQGQVDEQTGQLLEQEKRNYEAELSSIKEMKDAISQAIVSGGASQAEIAQMTDPNMPDDQRKALAQSIMGRTAGADRALQRRAASANAALAEAKLAAQNSPNILSQLFAPQGSMPFEEFASQIQSERRQSLPPAEQDRLYQEYLQSRRMDSKTLNSILTSAVVSGEITPQIAEFVKSNYNEDPATSNLVRAATTVIRDANDALYLLGDSSKGSEEVRNLNQISGFAAQSGVIGATTRVTQSVIPGNGVYEVSKLIQSVKDNIGIDTLLNIKREGSGLGQVPQSQLETLQGILGRLDIGRDPELLRRDIQDVFTQYQDIISKAGGEVGTMSTQTMQDGSVWQKNKDGSYTRIR